MYLKRVVLNNIKGFDTADLDLCPDGKNYPGWCVITGDNGAGKTALLRSIALAVLGPDQSRGIVQDLRGWVTADAKAGTISVEVRPDNTFDKTLKGGYPVRSTFWAEVEVAQPDSKVWELRATDIFRNRKKSAVNGPWAQSVAGWCCLAYGPFRRLYGSSPDAQRLMVLPGRIPHFATLFKEDATLAECEEWVRELQYKALEAKQSSGRNAEEATTLDNLLQLVGTEFLRHGVTISRVDSEGIWLCDPSKRLMPLTDMSEGYRSALAMLVDIFRHMVSIYGPDIIATNDDGSVYVDRPGVVMIDEVDAHLHPDWQREIGFWLQEHFPKVQFIVTTHSPLVCPAANFGRIYHLPERSPDSEDEPFMLSRGDYERVIAGKPDQILVSPAFGLPHVRSPFAVRARDRHARLMSKRLSVPLSDAELEELGQLELFARD
jgi:predicted ATP-dependent endonuclease of OLD family